MSRTRALSNKIDEAYLRGEIEETLRLVKELAEFRVSGKLWRLGAFEKDKHRNKLDVRKDDIIQEVLIAVWRAKLNRGVQYSQMVGAIIRNKIADFFMDQKEYQRWTVYLSDPVGKKNDENNKDEEGNRLTLLDTIDGKEVERRLQAYEGQYPNEEAFRAFSLQADGWSLKEIAAELGRSYGTLRNQMSDWRKEMEFAALRRMQLEGDEMAA